MVNRVGAILGVMGGHDGTNGIRQASALRITTAFYGCISWVDWNDIILCHRGTFLAHYPPHITLFLNLATRPSSKHPLLVNLDSASLYSGNSPADHGVHMTAPKLVAHPTILNHTTSCTDMVSCQLLPNGEHGLALRSQIWNQ